mmetsp:Transcript_6032/g.13622  ORF Transcript_6032/g.13622 Transcript_6032/m.13622 type:complete len:143 (+) Transcript_6032:661-1089(+)
MMVRSDEAIKTIKVILFSGLPQHFKIWTKKMMASANRRGFGDILTGKVTCPTWADYEIALAAATKSSAQKDIIKRMEKNELAYEELVQNDATTNSFQQFFGKGVTSAADSAKKLGEQLRIRKGLYSRYLWRRIRANKVSGCT